MSKPLEYHLMSLRAPLDIPLVPTQRFPRSATLSSAHTNAHARTQQHTHGRTHTRAHTHKRMDPRRRHTHTRTEMDAHAHKRADTRAGRRAGRAYLYNSIGRCTLTYKSHDGERTPQTKVRNACGTCVRVCARELLSRTEVHLSLPHLERAENCARRACVDPSVPQSTPHHQLSQTEYPPSTLRVHSECPPSNPLRNR
jgi:hypothetical protein